MDDEFEQPPTPPAPKEPPESPVDPAVLEIVKANLVARGGSAHQMVALSYPTPLLMDLLKKLADHTQRKDKALEWLSNECLDRDLYVPSESAFYRFARLVREEYRLAYMSVKRREAERWVSNISQNDPAAKQLALNLGLTELIQDEIMRAGDAGGLETDRLNSIIAGTRAVNMTAMDKQKMDARIKALESQNAHRAKTIEALQQRIDQLPEKVKSIQEKLDQVEKAQAAGKKIDASVYAAIRAELTRVKEAA